MSSSASPDLQLGGADDVFNSNFGGIQIGDDWTTELTSEASKATDDPNPKKEEKPGEQFLIDGLINHTSSKELLTNLEKIAPEFATWIGQDRFASALGQALGWTQNGLANPSSNLKEISQGLVSDAGGDLSKVVSGKMTLGELAKRRGKTPNRAENVNPLGIPDILSSVYDQVLSVLGQAQATAAATRATQASDSVDNLRNDVYALLGKVIAIQALWKLFKPYVAELLTDNDDDFKILYKYGENLLILLDTGAVIDLSQGSDIETQLFQLKAFFFSFGQHCNRMIAAALIDEDKATDFQQIVDGLLDISNIAGQIIYAHKDVSSYVTESVFALDPRRGPFQARGDLQIFDAVSWATNSGSRNTGAGFLNDPLFRNYRKTYTSKNLSSYPKIATDYGNVGPSERDVADAAWNKTKTNFETAAPAPGTGDKIQRDKNVEAPPIVPASTSSTGGTTGGSSGSSDDTKGTVGSLDESMWEKYKSVLGKRESGNDYGKVNSIGFSGRWQFGGPALADLGYVRPGTSTRTLKTDAPVWTGKDGINSRQDFLQNKNKVQDKAILEFTRRNYKTLLRMGVLSKGDEPKKCAGYLMAAHLKGPGGAKKLANGMDNADAYGTKASSYYKLGASAIDGNMPSGEVVNSAAGLGASPSQQRAAFVDSTTLSDGAPVSMPPSDTSSVRNPYNRVKVAEAGHFKEYDSTPGNERIQERHRTGTGYEIDASGQMKTLITTNCYRAVMGSDYLMVQGHCHIIAKGDIGIRADGNLNINAGLDLNFVAAGNVNWHIGGDEKKTIQGSKNTMVSGDRADQTDGFHKQGVGGDFQLESASVNAIARDSQINLAAKTDANIMAVGNAHLLGKGKVMVTSSGDGVVSTGGTLGLGAGGDVGVSSGGTMGMKAGTWKVAADSTSIKSGGDIQVSPQVSHANWSEQSAKAGVANPGTAVVNKPANSAGDYDYVKKDEDKQRQEKVKDKKFDTAVADFNAIDGKTQGWGGGQGEGAGSGYTGAGYSKGVTDV